MGIDWIWDALNDTKRIPASYRFRDAMKTSAYGIKKIREHEGIRLKAYPDPATGGAPWTVGVGHTGPEVYPGMVISADEVDDMLRRDLEKFERGIERLVTVPLTQNQFDALVSLTFNIGLGNFGGSTLLRKLNARDYNGAADQILRWDKAAGRKMAGLTRRREAERNQFLMD